MTLNDLIEIFIVILILFLVQIRQDKLSILIIFLVMLLGGTILAFLRIIHSLTFALADNFWPSPMLQIYYSRKRQGNFQALLDAIVLPVVDTVEKISD